MMLVTRLAFGLIGHRISQLTGGAVMKRRSLRIISCACQGEKRFQEPFPILRVLAALLRTALLLLFSAGAVLATMLWLRNFWTSDCITWVHDTIHVNWVHTLRQDGGTRVIWALWSRGGSMTGYR